jgi:amino acid permease
MLFDRHMEWSKDIFQNELLLLFLYMFIYIKYITKNKKITRNRQLIFRCQSRELSNERWSERENAIGLDCRQCRAIDQPTH